MNDNANGSSVELLKIKLNRTIQKYEAEPISYLECITPMENATAFVEDITNLHIDIKSIAWWCFCSLNADEESGCPHGGGGPRSRYHEGYYFSEMYQIPGHIINNNDEIVNYLKEVWPKTPEYRPCLVPSFELDVPFEYDREFRR